MLLAQEVVAAAVRSGTFEGRRFGVVTSERTAAADVATNSAAGRKRPLVHMHCTLDSERLVDAFGADAQKRIPSSYSLTLDAPNGARILTFSESGGFVFAGVVVQSGNMVPDSADPAYAAYVTQRRQRDLTAQSSKKGTVLARDADASRLGAVPIAASKFAAPASGRSAALPAVPRVATIYALFEHGAYWTLQDMSRATAKREVGTRFRSFQRDIHSLCAALTERY